MVYPWDNPALYLNTKGDRQHLCPLLWWHPEQKRPTGCPTFSEAAGRLLVDSFSSNHLPWRNGTWKTAWSFCRDLLLTVAKWTKRSRLHPWWKTHSEMAPHAAISHRGGLPSLPALTASCPRGRQLNCCPKALPRLHTEQKAVQIFREWGEIFQLERVSSFFTGTREKKKVYH